MLEWAEPTERSDSDWPAGEAGEQTPDDRQSQFFALNPESPWAFNDPVIEPKLLPKLARSLEVILCRLMLGLVLVDNTGYAQTMYKLRA